MACSDLATQLAKLQKERHALELKEKELLKKRNGVELQKIVQLARAAGITADEIAEALSSRKSKKTLGSTSAPKKKSGKKVSAKYRNPADPNITWSGRGIMPKWAKELQVQGQLESARLSAES